MARLYAGCMWIRNIDDGLWALLTAGSGRIKPVKYHIRSEFMTSGIGTIWTNDGGAG